MLIDESLVTAMVAECFPAWEHLPVRAVVPGGSDNRTFRIGDDLVARLPSAERYVPAVEKEQRWLPVLAAGLPVPVPVPVAAGRPAAGFPWPWSVNRWLPGEVVSSRSVSDLDVLAGDVADVLLALHRVPTAGAPPSGEHNFHRGGDLAVYDPQTRAALAAQPDPQLAAWGAAVWRRARRSRWTADPVWVHGDVGAANLLVDAGRLSSVIDFGGCGVGDPASDLVLAWTFLDRPAADAFAERLGLDDGTWERGAGWALWKALISLDEPGPGGAVARRTIDRLREDLPRRPRSARAVPGR